MKKRYFGTDGIRGKVGEEPITAEFMLKLGWALGRVLAKGESSKVVIGKDTRTSGYMFESALEAGLSAAGVDILLLGPMPTPAVAYLTRTFRAQAGIVISASHNPYFDNGIKFFSAEGKKLPDSTELEIEAQLDEIMKTVDSAHLGKAERIEDSAGRYIEFCKSTIPAKIGLHGLRVVLDCANGATYHVAPAVFEELGAEVIAIGVEPDGLNINENCGSTQPDTLSKAVLTHRADLGIALDGDGDRLIMVDGKGEIIDGDEILFIIANSFLKSDSLGKNSVVVGTLMSNLGLEHALANLGIKLERANVGDRYVMEMLKKKGGVLGGESSGHIICLNRSTTGDGLIAALQVLNEVRQTGKTLHELKSGMKKYPQKLINVRVNKKFDFRQHPLVSDAIKIAEAELADTGRILLRESGTEPLIRVMVEGRDHDKVCIQAEKLAHAVKLAAEKKS
ncbi:MAG: phosphoglucosamine mutase [Gammaproteobacteria bacterium]|nr:phosphoglucosamine mutase [Gammaproteobacteria bacterium]